MAEIKHTFTAGRMNKDLDERLVPNGEYRDASNVQVRTTDGDAAGTIQNLQGNIEVGSTNIAENFIYNSDFSLGSDGWVDSSATTFANNNVKITTSATQTRTLGPERFSNGDFTSDPSSDFDFLFKWIYNSSIDSLIHSDLNNSQPGNSASQRNNVFELNKKYEVVISARVDHGKVVLNLGGNTVELFKGLYYNDVIIVENTTSTNFRMIGTTTKDNLNDILVSINSISVKEITGYTEGVNELKTKSKHITKGESYSLSYDVVETNGALDSFSFYNGKAWNPIPKNVGSYEQSFSTLTTTDRELKIKANSNTDSNAYIVLDNIKLKNITELVSEAKCIGSVADERNDKAYFMFASEEFNNSDPSVIGSETKYIDYIIQQSSSGNTVNVLNDVFGIAQTASKAGVEPGSFSASSNYSYFEANDASYYRPGMEVKFITNSKSNLLKDKTRVSHVIEDKVYLDKVQTQAVNSQVLTNPTFEPDLSGWGNADSNSVVLSRNSSGNLEATKVSSITKFKTLNANSIQTNKEYKVVYKIVESTNVTELKVYTGGSTDYKRIPHQVGVHEVVFKATSNSNLFFQVFAPTNGDHVEFEYISLYDYSTVPVYVTFKADKVLGFDQANLVTGVNVIDDLLMWTDGYTEPKKVNIRRSIAGTANTRSHTKLHVDTSSGLRLASEVSPLVSKNLIANGKFSTPLIGGEMVINGDFSSGNNGWSITQGGWNASPSSGSWACDGTQTQSTNLAQSNVLQGLINKNVVISFEITAYTTGSVRFITGDGSITGADTSGVGTYEITSLVPTDGAGYNINIQADSNFVGSVSNVSIKEVFTITSTTGWMAQQGGGSSISLSSNRLRLTLSSALSYAALGGVHRVEVEKGKSYKFTADGYIGTSDSLKLWTSVSGFSDEITSSGTLSVEFIASETGVIETRLYVAGVGGEYGEFDNVELSLLSNNDEAYLEEKHITVIKSYPKTAPVVDVKTFGDLGYEDWIFQYSGFFDADNLTTYKAGDQGVLQNLPSNSKIKVGDALIIEGDINGSDKVKVQVRVNEIKDSSVYYSILSIDTSITANHINWSANISEPISIFEDKFCRFAYRYKYNDGEYSPMSPWSEIAFQPKNFDFKSVNGYNEGMVNQVKEIHLSGMTDYATQLDIMSVEVLFRDTSSTNVYIVKDITKGLDPEWLTGNLLVNSEIMHELVSADQTLRIWDNVPKQAKAQEIIGNRLVYGNYTQGYDLSFKPSIEHSIKSTPIPAVGTPNKSIKSASSYKVGVVFEDKYGRQTPVVSVGDRVIDNDTVVLNTGSGSINVPKSNSSTENKITVAQNWDSLESSNSQPEDWISSAKYYIKEGSSNYYNLVMDRWYNAEDGNIWLSFLSSDRNKIDDEAYLSLKKSHGSDEPVVDEARYKVLSISNEAPDFIKTSNNILGSINVPEDTYYEHTGGSQPRLSTNFDLYIDRSDYNSFNPSGIPIESKGNLKVRLLAEITNEVPNRVLTTGYVDVNYFTQPTDDSANNGQLRIKQQFGDQANFYKRFVDEFDEYTTFDQVKTLLSSGIHGAIKYELVERVVENKPEFDGRFFVKINRNESISYNVLGGGKVSSVFEKQYSLYISNINTNINASNGRSNYGGTYVWGSRVFGTYTDGDLHPNPIGGDWDIVVDNKMALRDYGDESKAYWQWWKKYRNRYFSGKYEEANLFIDGAAFVSNLGTSTNSGGIYTTSGTVDGTLNKIDIGFPSAYRADQSQLTNIEGVEEFLSVGSIFSFTKDPNKYKYRVSSVERKERISYYDSETGLTCDRVSGDPTCSRVVYTLTFEVLNQNGTIVPNKGLDISDFDPRSAIAHDGTEQMGLDIYSATAFTEDLGLATKSNKGGVWETIPNELVDVDLYYEASNSIPMVLDGYNVSDFAPLNSKVYFYKDNSLRLLNAAYTVTSFGDSSIGIVSTDANVDFKSYGPDIGDAIQIIHDDGTVTRNKVLDLGSISTGDFVSSQRVSSTVSVDSTSFNLTNVTNWNDISIGSYVQSGSDIFSRTYVTDKPSNGTLTLNNRPRTIANNVSLTFYEYGGAIQLDKNAYKYPVDLAWFNCYSFGNGVESNRIRDDFNAPVIGSGFKVSTTFLDYAEEKKTNSLIYSGIYNSSSKVNDLSEFNMSFKITKDLNPSYGSIQALKTRDTNLNVFTEDKVLKVLANKDALFNADGNTNVTSTDRVLGQAVPYAGDYGISKNPESLASDQYRTYFTDKQRGAVLRLSIDGLTPISNVGMKTWFRDNLRTASEVIGGFDIVNGEYNVTIKPNGQSHLNPTTVSFNEASKGWVSFKSFIKDSSVSVSGKYLSTSSNKVWEHYSDEVNRNTFYDNLGPNLIENGSFNSDLRAWDISIGASGKVTWSNKNPYVDVPTLELNGLTTKVLGKVSQSLIAKTSRNSKYEIIFDYYIVSGKLTVDLSGSNTSNIELTTTGQWQRHYSTFDTKDDLLKSISLYGVSGHAVYANVSNISIRELKDNFKPSELTALINDIPDTVKSFKTISYSGSEGKVVNVNNQTINDAFGDPVQANDGLYSNLSGEPTDGYGWQASISTDLSSGEVISFAEKEGKWFGQIVGDVDSSSINVSDIDQSDVSTQGLGFASQVQDVSVTEVNVNITNF